MDTRVHRAYASDKPVHPGTSGMSSDGLMAYRSFATFPPQGSCDSKGLASYSSTWTGIMARREPHGRRSPLSSDSLLWTEVSCHQVRRLSEVSVVFTAARRRLL